MKELEQITQLWGRVKSAGESAVLATVVKTRGSSYRSPGARLLLTQTGERAGSISGGCLEEELVRKAWWFTENGPVVRRYDTTADGEIASGYGLGCNGIIYVLLERVTPADCEVLDLISEVMSQRKSAVLGHVISSPAAGQRFLSDCKGESRTNISDPDLNTRIETELKAASRSETHVFTLGDGVEVFAETLVPPTRLLIFGAGDDAVPLTQLARYLGWQVMLFDGRAHYARPGKFPEAELVMASSAKDLNLDDYVDPWTVAVVMTHSYSQDMEALQALSLKAVSYLGVLGPRKRALQLMKDSRAAGNIHSPMGLDIGADGPEQVALSVIAEIQGVLNKRNGGSLANRTGPIHTREEDSAPESQDSFVRSIACV